MRPGDGVHSLLHLAAKRVARCTNEDYWKGCLPDELQAVIEKMTRKHGSGAGMAI
jgi:hypothetical protein